MDDQHRMIPMGDETFDDEPGVPPTVKLRNAAQKEVTSLLDALAPERAPHRHTAPGLEIERHRTPRGCILQAADGAVSVSWFADSAQGSELGELQVVAWRGKVSRPGSSLRSEGAKLVEELVVRPVESRAGTMMWRAADGTSYTTQTLVTHCLELLEQWRDANPTQRVVRDPDLL